MTRDDAQRLDASDPLAPFVDAFVDAEPDLVYFDGNSLGRLPRRTVERLAAVVGDEWGRGLVRSWSEWIDLPTRVGDRLAAAALGAAPGQVVVADGTTVNLYKVVGAALAARPGRRAVVVDGADFPTDRYVVEGLAAARDLEVRWVDGPDAPVDADVAVVLFSMVDYRSGSVADVASVTAAAHGAGALAVWDLSHAAGAVPVHLDDWEVDLAVGCTYKYLNGGPGAPAWLYVRRELQDALVPPVWGWFGHARQFAMEPGWEPAPGMRRWLSGTPPILGLAAVEAGVSLLEEAGIERVAAKGQALARFAIEVAQGFGLQVPAPPRQGCHIAVRHPEAYRLSRALITEAATVPDFRPPDVLRIGLAPLSTRFTEVWDGLDRLRRLVEERAWERYDATPGAVT